MVDIPLNILHKPNSELHPKTNSNPKPNIHVKPIYNPNPNPNLWLKWNQERLSPEQISVLFHLSQIVKDLIWI